MAHPLYRKFLHLTRTLHTYGTMLALIVIIFFSFTGVLLDHPLFFGLEGHHDIDKTASMPMEIAAGKGDANSEYARKIEVYLRMHEGAKGERSSFEDEGESVRVQFTGSGRTTDYSVAKADGKIEEHFEIRSAWALMADLHKGKGTGDPWRFWIIDMTAILLVFACVTGVILWISLPKRRTLGIVALVASIVLCAAGYFLLLP